MTKANNTYNLEQRNRFYFIALSILSFLGFLFFLSISSSILNGTPVQFQQNWVPKLGVNLDFYIDGLSLLFCLLISGIGTIIFLYSAEYFKPYALGIRIGSFLFIFALAMIGLVTADNLITLFVFWELTTITSYLLIGTKHYDPKARKLALQALIVTGSGALALLAGFVLIGNLAGTYQISEIIQQNLTDSPYYTAIFILVVLGCFTKSAQLPFHFWLPNAMAAPTPISAFLHSATMVKAGIFLLARLHPSLGGTNLWFFTLITLGGITAVWASIVALRQTDLKLMMAYTTLMALGTIVLFLGSETEIALTAAMTFLMVHALYKATLFLVVGNIEHATGTREWPNVSGLYKVIPLTAVVTVLAGLSMAGFPPLLGFIGKELKYKGALGISEEPTLIVFGIVLAAILMAGIAFFIIIKVFLLHQSHHDLTKHKAVPLSMSAPLLLLAFTGLLFGLASDFTVESLIQSSVGAIKVMPGYLNGTVELKLWYGLSLAVYLSAATAIFGLLIAFNFKKVSQFTTNALSLIPITFEDIYNHLLNGILYLAEKNTRLFQNGLQRLYILTGFITLILLSLLAIVVSDIELNFNFAKLSEVPLYLWILTLLIIVGIVATVVSHVRLLSVCALGVVGTGVALLFVAFGAPDVAMTQFMVEILVVIIMTMVMLRLPTFSGQSHGSNSGRIRDGVVAITSGLIVTLAMLTLISTDFDRSLTSYYEQKSYTEAHGKNIVNVILVDFRAIDTLGEILVVSIAGLASYALIKLKK